MSDCGCNEVISNSTSTENCNPPCEDTIQSECVVYSGERLDNLDVDSNEGINSVFSKVDALIDTSIKSIMVTIPSADVLTLYSTPYVLITSPGTDNYIELLKVSAFMGGDLAVAYTTGVNNLGIKSAGATNYHLLCTNDILGYTDGTIISHFYDNSTSKDTIRTADDITIQDLSQNPQSGTGDLILNITYKINSIN